MRGLGYRYLPDSANSAARDGENQVLLRDTVIESIRRLNDLDEETARAVYGELLGVTDNQRWTSILRGDYSRTVPGEKRKRTIRLVDFLHPEANTFTVTNQLYVKAEKPKIADVVVFVNGIPLTVIECKSPIARGNKANEAFEQIRQYERDVPRLFYSNLFNLVTDGGWALYGATGAKAEHWAEWKDPWPRRKEEFATDLDRTLWAMLAPERLLDLLAHFVVFEARDQTVLKKICRYQQFRAVNKMVARVVEGRHKRGLVWHTQGSGKSLTMAYATLKLKTHRTLDSPALANPNLMVLTDRVDLDTQITKTFEAVKLPNPKPIRSIREFHQTVRQGTRGLTVLSTLFKFQGSKTPLADSKDWIVLVDECHRTQEKDLGAFLRATLPEATFFGFTGTPVKTSDKDTYTNFGVPGETYLDRYSIDDAVADGATVPIRYMGRKTEWALDGAKLDVLFDQWFADLDEGTREALKKKGVSFATLAKHEKRIGLIAYDLWTHYKEHVRPDGFKAQIVGIDREAAVLYKRALDDVIAADLEKTEGLDPKAARARATAMSACVVSANQNDGKPSEDEHTESIRGDLRRFVLDRAGEEAVVKRFLRAFHRPGDPGYEAALDDPPLCFLIVCNKLLTGFDAPLEAAMYLDSPLQEHNLLQAIARTNRVAGDQKKYGLIVDYIGVTRKLAEALASYRAEDVGHALRDLDELEAELKGAHAAVMALVKGVPREGVELAAQYRLLWQQLGSLDLWFTFRTKAQAFLRAYEALAPDPHVLAYRDDLKFVAGAIPLGTRYFEKKEAPDLGSYSAKIRAMLEEHLDVTGLRTACALRDLGDPEFWQDFATADKPEVELETAAIRKVTELRKILRERMGENPRRYAPFSARVEAILQRFEQGALGAAGAIDACRAIAEELRAERTAHEGSGLSERGYGILKILETFVAAHEGAGPDLRAVAGTIDALYASDDTAPVGWHQKPQLQKELRQEVRRRAHQAGFKDADLKAIPAQVEEYALQTYRKLG